MLLLVVLRHHTNSVHWVCIQSCWVNQQWITFYLVCQDLPFIEGLHLHPYKKGAFCSNMGCLKETGFGWRFLDGLDMYCIWLLITSHCDWWQSESKVTKVTFSHRMSLLFGKSGEIPASFLAPLTFQKAANHLITGVRMGSRLVLLLFQNRCMIIFLLTFCKTVILFHKAVQKGLNYLQGI